MAYIDTSKLSIPKGFFEDLDVPKLLDWLNSQPTADVVEVVRCGQCECYKEYLNHDTKEPTGWGKCNKIEMDIDLARNDFCCYGERKNT